MRLTNLALLSTGLVFGLFACRGSDGGDDTPMPDGPPGGSVKIQDIQNDAMPSGTAVEVRGVIVTAIDNFGARTGDLWVQDPAGGPFSGIKVFGAPLDQVGSLQVGDLVDITNAQKDEFKCGPPICSTADEGSITELKGAGDGMLTITKKGTGTVPAPAMVDAKAIALMTKADRVAEWEKWEGVLVKVTGARQLAAARTFSDGNADQHEFRITGIARVQSVLADLNADAAFGVCYDSITGIGDHFFSDLILPRSAADIVSGGAGCNPMPTNIVMAQTTQGAELVNLTNVFVTARDDIGNNKGFWVADSLAGAASNGVYVFTGTTAPDAGLTIGARVDIQGAVEEFDLAPTGGTAMGDTVTEVTNATYANIVAAAAPPTPATTATVAQLNDIGAAGEPWEGVLVGLTQPLKVTANLNNGKWELTANDNSKIVLDDESFAFPTMSPPPQAPAVGKCYSAVVGVMHVQVTDDLRTLNPRQATDLTIGAGCN